MCLARAYVGGAGKKELLAEEIASVKTGGGKVLITTLFGEKTEIAAEIKEIDFRDSSILLERAG